MRPVSHSMADMMVVPHTAAKYTTLHLAHESRRTHMNESRHTHVNESRHTHMNESRHTHSGRHNGSATHSYQVHNTTSCP